VSPALRVGTRGSALAMAQARLVARALEAAGARCETVIVETAGDRRAPDTPWGEGAFVAAIEEALLEGRVDVAVHSAKDVPTREDARLRIAAYLPRLDPRDALVVRPDVPASTLRDLPAGSRLGTDSPRRAGFLLAARPDLVVVPIHGNVDTRLRRLDGGEAEALVLAVAGLERLGRAGRISQRLGPETSPPAPGQGAIAVQVRAGDVATLASVAMVDDALTRTAVELERAFLRAMGGGCRSPIGALAEAHGDGFRLLGGVAALDGSRIRVEQVEAPAAEVSDLVARLARSLGGPALPPPARPPRVRSRPRVLVTRPAESAAGLAAELERLGIAAVSVPAIAIQPLPPGGALDEALLDGAGWDRVVVSSRAGAAAVLEAMGRLGLDPRAWRWAAVGPTTAGSLMESGVEQVWVPTATRGSGLAAELPVAPGDRVLVAQGDLAGDALVRGLRARGASVRAVVAYRTREAPAASARLLADALAEGPMDAVLLASGSAARGILALAGGRASEVATLPAICLGPETAAEARRLGFRVIGSAPVQSAASLADLSAVLVSRLDEGVPA
jgi:hydroxymethylbilane synthase